MNLIGLRHSDWATRLPSSRSGMRATATLEEMCLTEQYRSMGVCRKTQESEESRSPVMADGEGLLGNWEVKRMKRLARIVQVQYWGEPVLRGVLQ